MMLASLCIGEALGLKQEKIDFEKELLYVEQSLTKPNNLVFGRDEGGVRGYDAIRRTIIRSSQINYR